jgi:hypothetical protein
MKVKNVKFKQPQWFESNNPLLLKTSEGEAAVTKFYFNGYSEVIDLLMEKEGVIYTVRCTFKHKFKTDDNRWVECRNLTPRTKLTNGWVVNSLLKTSEIMPTFDVEVPTTHDYILDNGVVTHNSSSILMCLLVVIKQEKYSGIIFS